MNCLEPDKTASEGHLARYSSGTCSTFRISTVRRGCPNIYSIYNTVFTLSIWTPQLLTILALKFLTSTIYYPMVCLKVAGSLANSVDSMRCCVLQHLILVYTFCSGLSVWVYWVTTLWGQTDSFVWCCPENMLLTFHAQYFKIFQNVFCWNS